MRFRGLRGSLQAQPRPTSTPRPRRPQPGCRPGHRSQQDVGGSPSPGLTFPPSAEWTHQLSSVSPRPPRPRNGAPRPSWPPRYLGENTPPPPGTSPGSLSRPGLSLDRGSGGCPSPALETRSDPCPAVQQARPGDPEHPVLTGSETSPPQAQRAASVPPRCPALTAGGWQGSADHLPGTAEGHSSSDTCLFGRGGAGTQAQGQLGWPGRSQSQQGRDATSPGPSAPRRAHPRCRATQGPSRGVTRPLSQARDPCDQPAPCCVLKDASRLDTLHLGHLQPGSRGALAWGAGQGGRGGPRRYLCLLRGTARPACWCASGRRTRPRRG